MSPFVAELIGTALLLLIGNGVVANVVLKDTKGENSGWIVITFGWAMAVFVAVFVAAEASGAHINPAVTLGLAIAGKFAWAKVPMYIGAQMLGAALGTTLAWLMYIQHYKRTEDKALKLATFATIPAIEQPIHNLISEFIGTFVLMFAVLYISGPNFITESPETPPGLGAIGALPVALLVLAIGLALGGTTGYAINPARDLGPRIMHQILPVHEKGPSNWHYAWVPVVGPVLGAAAAALVFGLIT